MKLAATKYAEEEKRANADKEEKLSKFRDSAADAAARVIQMMYYVFSVSDCGVQRSQTGETTAAPDTLCTPDDGGPLL